MMDTEKTCERIIQNCIDRLKQHDTIDPDISTIRDELSNQLGGHIAKCNDEINKLEKKLDLLASKKDLINLPNKMKFKIVEGEIRKIKFDLAEKKKDIVRQIKSHAHVKKNIQKMERDRDLLVSILELTMNGFLYEDDFTKVREELRRQRDNITRNEDLRSEVKKLAKTHFELSESLNREESNKALKDIRRRLKETTDKVGILELEASDESLKNLYRKSESQELEQVNGDFDERVEVVKNEIGEISHRIDDEKIIHDQNRIAFSNDTSKLLSQINNITIEGAKEISNLEANMQQLKVKRKQNLEYLLVSQSEISNCLMFKHLFDSHLLGF